MKILHLINSGGMYGAERVVLILASHLNQKEFKPLIVQFEDIRHPHLELVHRAREAGVTTEAIPCRRQVDLRALRALKQIATRRGVDLLHCHGFKADLYGLIVSRWAGIPAVATNHSWTHENARIRMYERLDALFLRWFPLVVAVSDSNANEMAFASQIDPSRIRTIYNGIDLRQFNSMNRPEAKRTFGVAPDSPTVGIVGRLSPEKGHGVFVEAAQKILRQQPRTQFLIVGDGALRDAICQQVRALGIEMSVKIVGFQSCMADVYCALDVLVSTSFREGTPIVLLEAMASGVPAVATTVGGVPALAGREGAIVLLKPGDPEELARAVCKLLSNPEERARQGSAGRRRVTECYSADRMAMLYGEVYRELSGLRKQ